VKSKLELYHIILMDKLHTCPTDGLSVISGTHPGLTVVLNPEKPRRKSFEITLLDGETSLWTGIKKGPPGRLKFPQPDVVVAALQEALKAE
uniref:Selenoprotein H n=1 Tax=Dicentrarchus labrax TaxID=13489 RepID=A0A8C4NL86_DICLA